MKMIRKKGQAEIMDGLILMLIAATCSVVLLTISSNYGSIPIQIYEESYAQKLAQNTLLSLYHITDQDQGSAFYRKSIMVAVSEDLSEGDTSLAQSTPIVQEILDSYADPVDGIGWEFMFTLLSGESIIVNESVISTDHRVSDRASFKKNVGKPSCASAALTYPNTSGCIEGKSAGNMCYAIFEICTWLP